MRTGKIELASAATLKDGTGSAGTSGQVLASTGPTTGTAWVTPSTGTVTSVSGTAPISVATGTTTPAISISAATTSVAGSMSAADKTKLDAVTGTNTGDQTITLSGIVTGTGTGAITTAIADATLSIAKTNGLQAALDLKTNINGEWYVGGNGTNSGYWGLVFSFSGFVTYCRGQFLMNYVISNSNYSAGTLLCELSGSAAAPVITLTHTSFDGGLAGIFQWVNNAGTLEVWAKCNANDKFWGGRAIWGSPTTITYAPFGGLANTAAPGGTLATERTYVTSNASITGATKTKITYDTQGLVTAGADATTADIADSTNKRYVTDAQLTVIGNTSGSNSGDQTGGTPALTLGTANTAGTSTNFIRRDDTILAFDTTVPLINATTALAGTATVAARRDHVHPTDTTRQAALTLTTTGTSGAATLSGGTLNIPQYSGGSGGSVKSLETMPFGTVTANVNGFGASPTSWAFHGVQFTPQQDTTISTASTMTALLTQSASGNFIFSIYRLVPGGSHTRVAHTASTAFSTAGYMTPLAFSTVDVSTLTGGVTYIMGVWYGANGPIFAGIPNTTNYNIKPYCGMILTNQGTITTAPPTTFADSGTNETAKIYFRLTI